MNVIIIWLQYLQCLSYKTNSVRSSSVAAVATLATFELNDIDSDKKRSFALGIEMKWAWDFELQRMTTQKLGGG